MLPQHFVPTRSPPPRRCVGFPARKTASCLSGAPGLTVLGPVDWVESPASSSARKMSLPFQGLVSCFVVACVLCIVDHRFCDASVSVRSLELELCMHLINASMKDYELVDLLNIGGQRLTVQFEANARLESIAFVMLGDYLKTRNWIHGRGQLLFDHSS